MIYPEHICLRFLGNLLTWKCWTKMLICDSDTHCIVRGIESKLLSCSGSGIGKFRTGASITTQTEPALSQVLQTENQTGMVCAFKDYMI